MSEFARSRAVRQFYRNQFTWLIELPEADVMPAHIVAEIFSFKSTDIARLKPMVWDAKTGLDADKDAALKNLLCAIILANQALDESSPFSKEGFPAEISHQITEYVVSALKADSNVSYLVAAIQVLFRVNEISSALFLINNNLSLVSNSAPVLKILLLICVLENDYNQAMVVIQALTADASLIGEDPLALLIITCGIYKLGGIPDSYIDFRPLQDSECVFANADYHQWIKKTSGTKTTVLVTCDKSDYYAHAVPLLYSIYETNRDVLDVHLHLFNCDDDVKQHLMALSEQLPDVALSASHEIIASNEAMSVAYACRRLVFLRHALQTFDVPILALHSTMLMRQRWTPTDAPLTLLHSESSPFWEDVFPGFIYAKPGGVAQRYLDRVAHFVDVNLQGGNFTPGLEQVALFASLDALSAMEQLSISRVELTTVLNSADRPDVDFWLAEKDNGPYADYVASLMHKYQR